jgi:hypothetical protein
VIGLWSATCSHAAPVVPHRPSPHMQAAALLHWALSCTLQSQGPAQCIAKFESAGSNRIAVMSDSQTGPEPDPFAFTDARVRMLRQAPSCLPCWPRIGLYRAGLAV